MKKYQGKVVFVSGGTSGINLGIAEGFAREGATVAVASRKEANVNAALEQLRQHGGEVSGFVMDVRQYDNVAATLAVVAARHGPIDVLISGAAGNFLAPASEMSANAFKTVIDIDLQGTFNVMRAAWAHLRKPGAAIINITAAQSWLAMPGQVHVCAAKAGIDQITRTLAMEWGPEGVRVNSIAPGPIADTEGVRRLIAHQAAADSLVRDIPLRRFGSRQDIAAAALWLCSDEAAYVTGVILSVDGGMALSGAKALTDTTQADRLGGKKARPS